MDFYNQLLSIQEDINNNGGFSYAKLDELNESNQLDELLKIHNIDYLLQLELNKFINLIDSNNYIYHEYLRKIYLDKCEFVRIFNGFGYILCLYFDNKDAYRDFPLFFKEATKHYNINKYNDMSIEDIEILLKRYLNLNKYYNLNIDKEVNEVVCRIPELYTDYSKYNDKLYNKKTINCLNKEEFFVYSEYEAYQRELYSLNKLDVTNLNEYVRWVARYDGDGFGYDVLSYDIIKNREKLIEVKSSITNNYELTENEYNTMKDTINNNYSDYYIYKYYYDQLTNLINLSILKYDKNNDLFIDINTNEVYNINPYFYIDEGIQKLKAQILPPEEKAKVLVNERKF